MRPRQASNRSGDSAPKRHESITHGWRLRTGVFCPVFLSIRFLQQSKGCEDARIARGHALLMHAIGAYTKSAWLF
ncbi:hypothetical protein NBRC111894_2527 [Sporolactobacillus inulinus]|uniref:Uncharacterized protein n=1 Tax=Sporolactobacillus inulinus TaxID=2078 RepID=A0A4Y1ZDC5_9BACL|nr:hypothetical protein NBRC111894_2527 [Sporolactobacillus inulinus]